MCVIKSLIGGSRRVHVRSIVNEVIRTISSLFILFLWNDFAHTKTCHKQKPTNKTKLNKQKVTKANIFYAHKNFYEEENRLFSILMIFYAQNLFIKKNKQAWNCPDNLIYYTTLMKDEQNVNYPRKKILQMTGSIVKMQ